MATAMAMEVQPTSFTCQIDGCPRTFAKASYLRRHQQTHSSSKLFPCPSCGQRFSRSDAMRRHQRRWHSADKRGEPFPAASSSFSGSFPSINQVTASPVNSDVSRSPRPPASVIHGIDPALNPTQQESAPGVPDTVWDSAPPAIISEVQGGANTFSGLDDLSLDGIDWNAPSLEALLLSFVGANIPGPELGENSYDFGGAWVDWEPESVVGLDPDRSTSTLLLPLPSLTSTVGQPQSERGQGEPADTDTGSSRPSGARTLPTDTDNDWSMGRDLNNVNSASDEPLSSSTAYAAVSPLADTSRRGEPPATASDSVPTRGSQSRHRSRLSPFQLAKWHRNNNWAVPDARTLQGFADHAFDVIIPHMLFTHMPLFRLENTSPALAFAFCIIGGVLLSEPAHHRVRGGVVTTANGSRSEQADSQPPGLPSSSADSSAGSDCMMLGDTWDAAPTVRDEVMAHLVKTFAVGRRLRLSEFNISNLQALVMLQAPSLLGDDAGRRARANMFRMTIVNITRRILLEGDHEALCEAGTIIPFLPCTASELDLGWRNWSQYETKRRTLWLVWHFDMMATVDTSIPCAFDTADLARTVLPCPNRVWEAPTAYEWLRSAHSYREMTLHSALQLFLSPPGTEDKEEDPGARMAIPPRLRDLGAFALTAVAITILRSLLELDQFYVPSADRTDAASFWITSTDGRPSSCSSTPPISREALLERYERATRIWYQAWVDNVGNPPENGNDGDTSSPTGSSAARVPDSPSPYCERGEPFMRLAKSALRKLKEPRPGGKRAFYGRGNLEEFLAR